MKIKKNNKIRTKTQPVNNLISSYLDINFNNSKYKQQPETENDNNTKLNMKIGI